MRSTKINLKDVRTKAAQRGILTMVELAKVIGCSRPSLYFAIAQPHRYSNVYRKLMEVIHA